MNQPANLIQLYKDLVRLVIRAQQLLLEEAIKEFLVECEKVSLQEAEIVKQTNWIELCELSDISIDQL